jgi:hypothetical protein
MRWKFSHLGTFKLNSKFIPLMQNMGFKGFPVPPGIKQMNYPSIYVKFLYMYKCLRYISLNFISWYLYFNICLEERNTDILHWANSLMSFLMLKSTTVPILSFSFKLCLQEKRQNDFLSFGSRYWNLFGLHLHDRILYFPLFLILGLEN